MGCYNTGAVNGENKVGGVVGNNDRNTSSSRYGLINCCYNTGMVIGSGSAGGVAGYNLLGATAVGFWLEGTNDSGIGSGGGTSTTSSFSAISSTVSAIYTSMSSIASSTGGSATGAVTDITFGGITIDTVTTDTVLGTLITPGGIVIGPTSVGGSTYNVSGLSEGTWILIKAVNSEDPKLNRIYTIYIS